MFHPRLLIPRFGLLSVLMLPTWLPAHDSPEHTVEALTTLMDRAGQTPDRLFQRATELRALGHLDQAAADLEAALELDSRYVPAALGLCRIRMAQSDLEAGLDLSARALASLDLSGRQRAELLIIRAQLLQRCGQWTDALAACNQALKEPQPPVDWYLVRSRLQRYLQLDDQRISDLERAWQQTGSAVVQIEFIEALIDARKWDQALAHLQPELASARWQSAWLIRRARVRLGQGAQAAGRADLQRAIDEINTRLNPARPDVTLVADRAFAHELLGEFFGADAPKN
jgi:tetratricopeptide (TPR) repeat protein